MSGHRSATSAFALFHYEFPEASGNRFAIGYIEAHVATDLGTFGRMSFTWSLHRFASVRRPRRRRLSDTRLPTRVHRGSEASCDVPN